MKTNLVAEIKYSGNAVKILFTGKVGRMGVHGRTLAFYPYLGRIDRASRITTVNRIDGHKVKAPNRDVPCATRWAVYDWIQLVIDACYKRYTGRSARIERECPQCEATVRGNPITQTKFLCTETHTNGDDCEGIHLEVT